MQFYFTVDADSQGLSPPIELCKKSETPRISAGGEAFLPSARLDWDKAR